MPRKKQDSDPPEAVEPETEDAQEPERPQGIDSGPTEVENAPQEAGPVFRGGEIAGRQVLIHRATGRVYDLETGDELDVSGEKKESPKKVGRPRKPVRGEAPGREITERSDAEQQAQWDHYRRGQWKGYRAAQLAMGNLENCPEEMPEDWIPPAIADHPVIRAHHGSMPPFLRKLFEGRL